MTAAVAAAVDVEGNPIRNYLHDKKSCMIDLVQWKSKSQQAVVWILTHQL